MMCTENSLLLRKAAALEAVARRDRGARSLSGN